MGKVLDEVSFSVDDCLNWKTGINSLSEELINKAAAMIEIPPKYQATWYGGVKLVERSFLVTIYAA